MRIWLLLVSLAVLIGLVVIAAPNGEKVPGPSAVAVAHGYAPGPYSAADFSISDDAVVMILRVTAGRTDGSNHRSMRLYGDGRLEIEAGEESYSRHLDRPRMLEIFRHAVDHGLAEFNSDVVMEEIAAIPGPEGHETVSAALKLASYRRATPEAPRSVSARLYAPEAFPEVVQSQALIALVAVLDAEIASARREGSIEVAGADVVFTDATFQVSSDPAQLILKWGSGGLAGHQHMELYGDGRLELSTRTDRFRRELTFAEMTALVRIAVDHGLAEWDENAVLTKVREVERGLARRMSDGTTDSVTLNLASYERGSYQREELQRSISFYNAGMVLDEAPNVLELQGIDALAKFAEEQVRQARGLDP